MLKALASFLLLLFLSPFLISVSSAENGFRCNCEEDGFWSIENIMECQKISDFLIAVAYFSIPIELLYFVSCSNIPFKWVLFQFISFIVLCGMTHLLNGWTYGPHSFQLMLALTIFKLLTALVSFATAITLITLIPLLLKVKVREFMLQKKTWDLDREVGIIKRQKETGLHVRMLTQEIRKSLDRHTILYTTLVELSKTLDLKNCAVWMPNASKTEMNLTHKLKEGDFDQNSQNSTIPTTDPDVKEIKSNDGVKILYPESALAVASSGGNADPECIAAIRMPMLQVSNFKGGTPEMVPACYAILVLVLPEAQNRSWSNQELEIVEVVADQVAVALSHASVLEESRKMREKLVEQNRALQQAKQDALLASQARNTFQTVMSNGLRRPMHSILGLLSVLHDEKLLCNEQRLLIDTMVKTSNVLSTLIADVMDISAMDNGRFPLVMRSFQLHSMVREAACLSKCLCAYRGYDFSVEVDKSLPNHVMGDDRRVFQVILHMVGNLLNKSRGGGLLVLRVYLASGSQGWNEQRWAHWRSNSSDGYAYIRVEVGICHTGSRAEDKFSVVTYGGHIYFGGAEGSMSFSTCKRLVQLMQGDIWVIPNPEGFDQSMALVLRFQVRSSSITTNMSEHDSDRVHSNSIFRGLKVLLADADYVNRAVTRKLLEKLGCSVSCVSSGYECLSALGPGGSTCQVVILDLHLPDLDGFEVTVRIRKYRSKSLPLIVALTVSGGDDTRDKCLQIGMNGVIQKPGTFREIGFELKRILLQANRLFS
ncbi:Enoyl-[acyl-carrier-protein] reductase [NADPH, B-specific] 2, mitochondrial [Castilleja foliolosa]|uniref:Ethylene receptor n=1 Tax=Castilleja foliolosa TaxID=1961234 RepID=A0ABD3E4T5_9LAMI